MIVIRANTPDQVLEQTILSLLQQAQIEAEQITFCAKKKLDWLFSTPDMKFQPTAEIFR